MKCTLRGGQQIGPCKYQLRLRPSGEAIPLCPHLFGPLRPCMLTSFSRNPTQRRSRRVKGGGGRMVPSEPPPLFFLLGIYRAWRQVTRILILKRNFRSGYNLNAEHELPFVVLASSFQNLTIWRNLHYVVLQQRRQEEGQRREILLGRSGNEASPPSLP